MIDPTSSNSHPGDQPPPKPGSDTVLRAQLSDVRRKAASVSVATGAYGVSYGALAVAAGMDVWQTLALSLLLFSGGSQFAFVGLIAGGGGPAAVTASTLLGLRNGAYGLQMSGVLGERGPRKLLAAHLTIDESTATAIGAPPSPDNRLAKEGFWWAGIGVWVLWGLGSLIGALIGDAIGDPKTYGLDAAATAAFLGLLWPRLQDHATRFVAVLAAVVAVAISAFAPAGLPILIAGLIAVLAGDAVARRTMAPSEGTSPQSRSGEHHGGANDEHDGGAS